MKLLALTQSFAAKLLCDRLTLLDPNDKVACDSVTQGPWSKVSYSVRLLCSTRLWV